MNPDELQAWQDRMFGNGYGSQVSAAEALNAPPQTYRNWLTGRRPISDPIALLCWYVEKFGPPEIALFLDRQHNPIRHS